MVGPTLPECTRNGRGRYLFCRGNGNLIRHTFGSAGSDSSLIQLRTRPSSSSQCQGSFQYTLIAPLPLPMSNRLRPVLHSLSVENRCVMGPFQVAVFMSSHQAHLPRSRTPGLLLVLPVREQYAGAILSPAKTSGTNIWPFLATLFKYKIKTQRS